MILFPFDWARKLTIPPCEEEKYNKWLVIAWPFFGIPFLLWVFFKTPTLKWLYIGLPIIVVLSLFLYLTSRKAPAFQPPKYYLIIEVLGTIMGLVWTYIATTILIDLLNAFIVFFKLNNTYMGLTVLGVGNALPDALTTI